MNYRASTATSAFLTPTALGLSQPYIRDLLLENNTVSALGWLSRSAVHIWNRLPLKIPTHASRLNRFQAARAEARPAHQAPGKIFPEIHALPAEKGRPSPPHRCRPHTFAKPDDGSTRQNGRFCRQATLTTILSRRPTNGLKAAAQNRRVQSARQLIAKADEEFSQRFVLSAKRARCIKAATTIRIAA